MSSRNRDKAALAAETWRRLFDFLMATVPHRSQVLEQAGLTPNDSKALSSLRERGKSMRELATEWGCDASNATWIVDRLEERGLAERRAVPGDRRVKLVVLTPRGEKTRARVMAQFYQPPPELSALSREQLERLREALEPLSQRELP